MKLSEFDYTLPEELIAQEPLADRAASRMLVLHQKSKRMEDRKFREFPGLLQKNDLLVFNQSKVIHARLLGKRSSGGKVEVFLLRQIGEKRFECLLRVTSPQKIGLEFELEEVVRGKVVGPSETPTTFIIDFNFIDEEIKSGASLSPQFKGRDFSESFSKFVESRGHIPLPPYIDRPDREADKSRYQTVYAKELGSVAAPTAGLHFTKEIFGDLEKAGIDYDFVTLHVGLGTFQPIKVENLLEHKMHKEEFFISDSLWEKIQKTKKSGGRVIAVGTTTVRSLESYARGKRAETDLFLFPGEKFQIVDCMLTNFHQSKSSLLVMLSAFAGKELLFQAYQQAIQWRYRFFSYGDCMFVVND